MSWRPRLLTGVGLLGLLGSFACFPLPTVVLPGSGPRPSPYVPPSVYAPSIAPSVSSLVYPTPGRQYGFTDRKHGATRRYTVTAIEGSVATFDITTTPEGGQATTATAQKITRVNGVFWAEAAASPVTKDIEKYPTESITVKAGTYPCFKVMDETGNYWFIGGICIRAVGPDLDFELVDLQ